MLLGSVTLFGLISHFHSFVLLKILLILNIGKAEAVDKLIDPRNAGSLLYTTLNVNVNNKMLLLLFAVI